MPQTKTPPKDIRSFYGTLGGDPEPRCLPAKPGSRHVYDPVTDQVIEKRLEVPELSFLTYSVATGGFGDQPLRWVSCVDREGAAFRLKKGDRVKLDGYFEVRNYGKDDQKKAVRQFVVVGAELAKRNGRDH